MWIAILEPQSRLAVSHLLHHYIPHQETDICNYHSVFKGISGAPAVDQYDMLAILLSVFDESLAHDGAKA